MTTPSQRLAELGLELPPVAAPVAAYVPATASAGVLGLSRRGRHVQAGLMLGANANAPLPWDRVIAHELTVVGSHGMAAAEYPQLLALIETGALDPGQLVGRVVDLTQASEELMALDRPVSAAAGIVVATVGREATAPPTPAGHKVAGKMQTCDLRQKRA